MLPRPEPGVYEVSPSKNPEFSGLSQGYSLTKMAAS